MPKLEKRITDSTAKSLRGPETEAEVRAGFVLFWCPASPGFGVRVSRTGDRAYISERRNAEGKTLRITLGKAQGGKAAGAISADMARKLQVTYSSDLQNGVERAKVMREQREIDKQDALTFGDALRAYVDGKRRGKDGLPLKERTKADYLEMVRPAAASVRIGKPFAAGPLFSLADKSITRIVAEDIRKVHKAAEARGARQATYAMQVLRAVLNWHGVSIEGSPLSKATAGRDRIVLPPTVGKPTPIPPERLKTWWTAACARAGDPASDGCRFILLTGCRPGEVFGSAHEPGLLVENVDLRGQRLTLEDTKNRTAHTVALSTHALEIVRAQCTGKAKGERVFDVSNPAPALRAINDEAEVEGVTPHKLRHTFASVAEELVSGYALRRMLNHADSDVTGAHYVGKSEAQLRAAWQTVADFICSAT